MQVRIRSPPHQPYAMHAIFYSTKVKWTYSILHNVCMTYDVQLHMCMSMLYSVVVLQGHRYRTGYTISCFK